VTQAAADRDRDSLGRPKNARPRDGLGRPLAHGAAGEPVTPDDLTLTPQEAVTTAQRLIDAGRPFHAHEVLEASWKAAPADQRAAWQGLAQIAVGLTHARRGNSQGAIALLRRGADAIGQPVSGMPPDLDLGGTERAARTVAAKIEAGGIGSLTETDLRPRILA
jgi:uncharacterized protein